MANPPCRKSGVVDDGGEGMWYLSQKIGWNDRIGKCKVGIVIIVARESIFQSSDAIIQE